MKVYTALVDTDFGDSYIFVYANRPTNEQVMETLRAREKSKHTVEYYIETAYASIEETEVIE